MTACAVAIIVCVGVLGAHAADRQLTKGQAQAAATAINLRHSDLPTLKQEAPATPAGVQADHQISAAVARCYGGPPYSDVLADVGPPAFAGDLGSALTFIISDTQIFASATLAADDLAAEGRPRGLACVLAAWRAAFSATAPTGQVVSGQISRIASVVAGTGVTFAIRMTLTTRPSGAPTGKSTIARVDAFGFVHGQAEGSLTVQTFGAVPAASTDRRLVKVLVARALGVIG